MTLFEKVGSTLPLTSCDVPRPRGFIFVSAVPHTKGWWERGWGFEEKRKMDRRVADGDRRREKTGNSKRDRLDLGLIKCRIRSVYVHSLP